MAKKIHIDDGNGNALCGLRVRGGEERGYFGDNPDHASSVIEGAVHSVIVEPAHTLMGACGGSRSCVKCCKRYKKINGLD